ncbi:hypothetical protein ACN47E_007561 [Coniothyrium glycines]
MDVQRSSQPRKRRAINACVNCRTSKVRCDGNRPCQRCEKNSASCQYFDAVQDESIIRIEKLERNLHDLRQELNTHRAEVSTESRTSVLVPLALNEERTTRSLNAIEASLISWDQATAWFHSFFSGSQYLVPIFCERNDTFASVSARSAILLDAVVSIGCRAEEGFTSPKYRQMQSLEDVQAIALVAAYSENGFVLIALALRFAMQLGLHQAIDKLMARTRDQRHDAATEEVELYRLCRVWHGICNLELFFSLDGGKLPGMTLDISPRKVRSLITHSERTAVDVRLLSQIELNVIRSEAYSKIIRNATDILLPHNEAQLRATVEDVNVELSLWLEEWSAIISTEQDPYQKTIALQNLNIQREWAMMTLDLKAVASSGIENVAIMTDFQRDFVRRAKEAASRHLYHMLQAPRTSTSSTENQRSTYLSTFKWTLDYVWAKCAVSVLLVLKLAILLRDPVPAVMLLLRDAHRVLEELKQVTVGHIAYFQILQTSIEKCEAALMEYTTQQNAAFDPQTTATEGHGAAEDEFQEYVPSEFVFEWDFPGLNLKHMPLGWQDLFVNIDSLF